MILSHKDRRENLSVHPDDTSVRPIHDTSRLPGGKCRINTRTEGDLDMSPHNQFHPIIHMFIGGLEPPEYILPTQRVSTVPG